MLDVVIVAIGKVKDKNLAAAITEYQQRLRPFARLKVVELKAEAFSTDNEAKAKELESQRLLEALSKYPSEQVWLLAEQAKQLDSLEWSEWLERSQSTVVLAIAGSLGWSQNIKASYPQQLSLGKITMPHELARLVLLEQLYRAAAIQKGKAYHH